MNKELIKLDVTNAFYQQNGVLYLDRIYKNSLYWKIIWHETDLNYQDYIFCINNTINKIETWTGVGYPPEIMPAKIIRGVWELPHSLKEVGYNAFKKTPIEKVIFQNDCLIKSAAFLGCELLTEVEIKSGSLDCETEGFENCLKLNKVDFEKINIRLSLKQASNLFAGTGFTNITIPNSWGDTLPVGLFRKCSNLEAIDFSHCAETIFGSHTFDDCPNLKTFIAKDGKQKLLITYIYYGNVGEDKEIKLVDPKGKILDEDFYGEKMKHNSKKSK